MATKRFRNLEREVKRLRRDLLPKNFNPLGLYSNAAQSRTRAFVVLAHAAMEWHFESEAKEILGSARKLWIDKGRVSRPLACLLAYSKHECKIPSDFKDSAIEGRFKTKTDKVIGDHYITISNNLGIKEHNLVAIFAPLGIDISIYSSVLVPSLDSLGATRGEHVHNGFSAVQWLDPKSEYDKIVDILKEILLFDVGIQQILRSIR